MNALYNRLLGEMIIAVGFNHMKIFLMGHINTDVSIKEFELLQLYSLDHKAVSDTWKNAAFSI